MKVWLNFLFKEISRPRLKCSHGCWLSHWHFILSSVMWTWRPLRCGGDFSVHDTGFPPLSLQLEKKKKKKEVVVALTPWSLLLSVSDSYRLKLVQCFHAVFISLCGLESISGHQKKAHCCHFYIRKKSSQFSMFILDTEENWSWNISHLHFLLSFVFVFISESILCCRLCWTELVLTLHHDERVIFFKS